MMSDGGGNGETEGRPLATIVIAAYNAEPFLGKAIESSLAQDYRPVEVVVVDDGSTDGTGDVARSYPQVRYVHQENQGPSAARNRGLEEAAGEFVAFLDADDEALPAKMTLQVGYLLDHPEVGCTLGRQEVAFEGGGAPEWVGHDPVYGDFAGIPLMSLVARRTTLLDLGGFDPELRVAEDRDLLVRMRERGICVEVVPEVVLRRLFHGENLSFERTGPHPILRSLKAKLDRTRPAGDETPPSPSPEA
jgi:glycosyltransferase involved in cell wall biosynthesis